jgi:hypothetical protein
MEEDEIHKPVNAVTGWKQSSGEIPGSQKPMQREMLDPSLTNRRNPLGIRCCKPATLEGMHNDNEITKTNFRAWWASIEIILR